MLKDEVFVRLPVQALLDTRLSRSALVVYAIMIDAADKWQMLEGLTIAEISRRSGVSEKTVRRAEAQLMAAGYITVHRTGRASSIEVMHDLRPMIRSSVEYFETSAKEA